MFDTKYFKILFVVCLLSVEYLATTTHSIKIVQNIWDKANHATAFFVLYVLLSLSFKNMSIWTRVVVLLFFGLQIEIVQYFIPSREFSMLDVVADMVGVVLGVVIFGAFRGRWKI